MEEIVPTGTGGTRADRIAALKAVFATGRDPYAGSDFGNAQRLGVGLWALGVAMFAILMPFAPPTDAIGDAGWIVAAIGFPVAVACIWLTRDGRFGFDGLLVITCVGLGQVACAVWLAGGHAAPYEQLYLLGFVYVAAVHPPRRVAVVLVLASLALLLPLAYDYFTWAELVGELTQLLLWWGIALVTMALMQRVRAQRLEGRAASRLARVDSLTGLGNRRAFEESLEREAARAVRNETALGLMILDVDSFKQINDRHGHPVGDQCLRALAGVLREQVRAGDLSFRWGGDEFAVLLPGTDAEGAEEVRARVVAAVRAAGIAPGGSPLVVSAGVAFLDPEDSLEQLVEAADEALLAAKHLDAAEASDSDGDAVRQRLVG
jgi:diguanylate cyclase (GGDEF)-like protein